MFALGKEKGVSKIVNTPVSDPNVAILRLIGDFAGCVCYERHFDATLFMNVSSGGSHNARGHGSFANIFAVYTNFKGMFFHEVLCDSMNEF